MSTLTPRLSRRRLVRRVLSVALGLPLAAALVAMLRRVQDSHQPASVVIPADVAVGLSAVEGVIVHRGSRRRHPRLFRPVHAPGLPDRSYRRRRSRVPVPRLALPRGRLRGGRSGDTPVDDLSCWSPIPVPAGGSRVCPERRLPASILTSRVGTLGDVATASFVIAAVSGVVLAVPYNPADGYGSIATLLLVNPAGVLFRNIHYWAGQALPAADAAARLGSPAREDRTPGRPGRVAAPRASRCR